MTLVDFSKGLVR